MPERNFIIQCPKKGAAPLGMVVSKSGINHVSRQWRTHVLIDGQLQHRLQNGAGVSAGLHGHRIPSNSSMKSVAYSN